MSPRSEYWIYRWIDEYEIQDRKDVARLFNFPGSVARLAELAREAQTHWQDSADPPAASVLAGAGIDLAGSLTCSDYECQKKAIDSAYGRIWHYFDHIVVEGYNPKLFLQRLAALPKRRHAELVYDIGNDVQTLLYLRSIGAEKYLVFRSKPYAFCNHHFTVHAEEFGLDVFLDEDSIGAVVSRLANEAEITSDWHKGVWRYWIEHPFFAEPASGSIVRAKKKKPTSEEFVARTFVEYSTALVADVACANNLGVPLARAVTASWMKPSASVGGSSDGEVALHLNLPFLDGLAAGDIIKLREDEQAHFLAFRSALTAAIKEQVEKVDSASPQEVAQSVTRQYIEPALANIERRLKANNHVLAGKAGTSMAISLAGASVGLIGSMPLIVAAGVAALGTALPHMHKYLEEKRDVQLADMYFLWKLKNLKGSH
ncbi:hypothetical protein ACFWY5_57315 [Nonomuraea sp. NPDC059007]|uniref:hypothetical protein n=1 Tax=Nonomuraea sp. NPDC059007 TaxID=3346692 RepID=UPI00367ADEC6